MFPRIVLHDDRGSFISLSHFCPTAARLLFEARGTASIVEAPAPLADIGELDGLDARGVWAPLLRPRVLMDFASYGEWERRAVTLLTRDTISPDEALASLQDVTAVICTWAPGAAALRDVVQAAFESHAVRATDAASTAERAIDGAVKRWLAARLFGTWTAYQGDGLAATLGYLRACLDTFTREADLDGDALEAIRRSDLRIVHGGVNSTTPNSTTPN